MPSPVVTENWPLGLFTPGVSGSRVFDVSGVTTFSEAAAAVLAQMDTGEGKAYPLVDLGEPLAVPTGGMSFAWNGRMVRVTANYTTAPTNGDLTYVSRKWNCRQRVIREVLPAGYAFVNSNGDPVSTGIQPTIALYTIELQMERYETGSGLAAKQLAFMNRVHKATGVDDTVTFPLIGSLTSGKILCKAIEIVDDFTSGSTHLLVRYTFHFRDTISAMIKNGDAESPTTENVHNFRIRIPDVGYLSSYKVSSSDFQTGYIVFAKGPDKATRPPTPVLLNGLGQPKNSDNFKVMKIDGNERPLVDADALDESPTYYVDDGNGVTLLYDATDGTANMNSLNIAANL